VIVVACFKTPSCHSLSKVTKYFSQDGRSIGPDWKRKSKTILRY